MRITWEFSLDQGVTKWGDSIEASGNAELWEIDKKLMYAAAELAAKALEETMKREIDICYYRKELTTKIQKGETE